ncbi:7432_t:CDS:2 [Entrophospora sp. SA101]|nr:7432_t:CDS:2 [Entrophospora sp. SA101]
MKTVGILGNKRQMTQILSAKEGLLIPVTPILVGNNVVSQVKTVAKEGYNSCQIAFGDCSEKNLSKPLLGHLKKNNIPAKKHFQEIRDMAEFEVGSPIDLALFQVGEKVKVTGTSKGKGTQGVTKRYGFALGSMSHGGGYPHRLIGSMGGGRGTNQGVPKGKKMPGRMGNEKITQPAIIEKVDPQNQVIFVRGAVPDNNKKILASRIKADLKKELASGDFAELSDYGLVADKDYDEIVNLIRQRLQLRDQALAKDLESGTPDPNTNKGLIENGDKDIHSPNSILNIFEKETNKYLNSNKSSIELTNPNDVFSDLIIIYNDGRQEICKYDAPDGDESNLIRRALKTVNEKSLDQQKLDKLQTNSSTIKPTNSSPINYAPYLIGGAIVIALLGVTFISYRGGSASTNRSHDSISKRLGIKKFGGEYIREGGIIVRQRGTKYKGGKGVFFGKDYTIHAEHDVADPSNLEHITIVNPKKILEGELAGVYSCEIYLPDTEISQFSIYAGNPVDALCNASEFVKVHLQGPVNRGYNISETKNGEDKQKILGILKDTFGKSPSPIKDQVNKAIEKEKFLSEKINEKLKTGWEFSRLPPLEKAILTYASYELLVGKNIDLAKMIIDQTINFSKVYCEEEKYKYINKVLDLLTKEEN